MTQQATPAQKAMAMNIVQLVVGAGVEVCRRFEIDNAPAAECRIAITVHTPDGIEAICDKGHHLGASG